jgi:hypothetical protein
MKRKDPSLLNVTTSWNGSVVVVWFKPSNELEKRTLAPSALPITLKETVSFTFVTTGTGVGAAG